MAQFNVEIIVRKGTTSEWASSSYILKAGEWGYDTELKIAKIGDGVSAWSALPAANVDTNTTYNLVAGDNNGELKLTGSDGSSVSAKVTGLGSAAYTQSSAYATAAQGTKADSALQPNGVSGTYAKVTVAEGLVTSGGGLAASDIPNLSMSKITGLDTALAGKADTSVTDGLNTRLSAAEGKITTAESDIDGLTSRMGTAESEIDALQGQIGGLTGAMHFRGKFEELPEVTGYNAGDVVLVGTKEYILQDASGEKSWVEFGDEGSYLTKTEASSTYQTKTQAASEHATITASVTAVDNKVTALDGRVSTAEGQITALETASATYATKDELGAVEDKADAAQSAASANTTEITKIKNGTTIVPKATGDASGNDIAATYATKTELSEAIADLPSATVTDVKGDNDGVSVSKQGTVYTVSHKDYGTGNMSTSGSQPYLFNSITVDKGHVTAINAIGLEAALAALGTITLNGGKADGTY